MADLGRNLQNYHLWHPFTQMAAVDSCPVIVRGDGALLFGDDGKEYLNLTSCLWNTPFGLGRDDIANAVGEQLQTLGYSTLFRAAHPSAVKLAGLIASMTPGALNRVFLTSNGSDSVESAIKMARLYFHQRGERKYKVISLRSSYHGVSYGALSASGSAEDKVGFGPMLDGFVQIAPPHCYRCEFGLSYPSCQLRCAEELERTILRENPDEVCMLLVEPVMGFGGVIVPPREYLPTVAAICKKYNVLLALDEVTTGFGRTGRMFACEHTGVEPDLMTLGKAISGGYFPLGAVVATDRIWEQFLGDGSANRFNDGSTNAGHPGGAAAGIAAMEILADGTMVSRARRLGELCYGLLNELRDIAIVGDVRGIGMMFCIELVQDRASKAPLAEDAMQTLVESCFASGLWVHQSANRILLLPPFIIEEEMLIDAQRKLRKLLTRAARWAAVPQ